VRCAGTVPTASTHASPQHKRTKRLIERLVVLEVEKVLLGELEETDLPVLAACSTGSGESNSFHNSNNSFHSDP